MSLEVCLQRGCALGLREALIAYLYSHKEKSLPPLLSVKNCGHAYQGQIKKEGATTALPLSPPFPHQNEALCIQIAREECGAILTHSLHSARGYNLQLVHPAGHGMAVHITAIKTAREKREGRSARRQERKKSPRKRKEHATFFIIKRIRQVL